MMPLGSGGVEATRDEQLRSGSAANYHCQYLHHTAVAPLTLLNCGT
jgi:hypothetical protein